jgi:hypothetical protein
MLPSAIRRSVTYTVLVTIVLTGCSKSIPDDATLIRIFSEHRKDFETLAAMFVEDTSTFNLARVSVDYVSYHRSAYGQPLSDQRLSSYRDLLRKLGLEFVSDGTEGGVIFVAFVRGWGPEGGVYKGYRFFPDGIPESWRSSVVDELHYQPKKYEPNTSLHRKIDKYWYLWFLY